MGCDIHSVAQAYVGKKWVTAAARPGGDERDYDSFAVMANVRNGRGFAGVVTGEGWPVISEPRGLPDDVILDNEDYVKVPPYKTEWMSKKESQVWMGDHSRSWLLLSEIKNFIKSKIKNLSYTKTGVVDLKTWMDIQTGIFKEPKEWCGGISGPNVVIVSENEIKDFPKDVAHYEYKPKFTHVQMSWKVPAMDCLYTLKKYINQLSKIAKDHHLSHDKVRLVFGFDS